MKKQKNEFYNEPWERDWYETGSTRPPKDRGGLIASLFMLVIVVVSIATALGTMNIRLFQMMAANQQTRTVYLSASTMDATVPAGTEAQCCAIVQLGLEGQAVSSFDRRFYHLPDGFLVTEVSDNYCAQQAGIRTGDVIISVDGQPIDSADELTAVLRNFQPGQCVGLQIYRQQVDKELLFTIEIGGEQP